MLYAVNVCRSLKVGVVVGVLVRGVLAASVEDEIETCRTYVAL